MTTTIKTLDDLAAAKADILARFGVDVRTLDASQLFNQALDREVKAVLGFDLVARRCRS